MKTIPFLSNKIYLLDEALNWATPGPGTWASTKGGKTGISPLEIGTKKQTFLENAKSEV